MKNKVPQKKLNEWLSNWIAELKLVYDKQSVNDIFVLFSDKPHAAQFWNKTNRQHNKINFNTEITMLSWLFLNFFNERYIHYFCV